MSNVITIEAYIDDYNRLIMHYSKCINEATIKILRKSAPNRKWNINTTYKANLTYELFKTIAFKFIFVENPNIDEIIDYVETKLRQIIEDLQENEK